MKTDFFPVQNRKLTKQLQRKAHFSTPQVLTCSLKEKKKCKKSQPVLASLNQICQRDKDNEVQVSSMLSKGKNHLLK